MCECRVCDADAYAALVQEKQRIKAELDRRRNIDVRYFVRGNTRETPCAMWGPFRTEDEAWELCSVRIADGHRATMINVSVHESDYAPYMSQVAVWAAAEKAARI